MGILAPLETHRLNVIHLPHVTPPQAKRIDIWIIWRYDREDDELPDVFSVMDDLPIFVITAY